MPMFGVIRLTFDEDEESMSGDDDFFSVARTMPLVAEHLSQVRTLLHPDANVPLIPSEVTP
jgi:hypothetical protein